MSSPQRRVNVTLDAEHALKLRQLAERTHTNEGTLARSLLSTALDEADPDPRNVAALLDAVPGSFDRAALGREQAESGLGISIDQL